MAIGDNISAATAVVGMTVRLIFFCVGTLVLGLIGLVLFPVWKAQPVVVGSDPAIRIASPSIAHLSVSGHTITSSRYGRIEVRQYGQLHNREKDLAVVMVMPPDGSPMGTVFAQDLRDVNILRTYRPLMSSQHYDLDTRFGEFRATEMRVDTDGRWKQCLAFRSRLDTPLIYLTGWLCDATGQKPSADQLACLLDRLTVDKTLASKDANDFVRARMTKPAYCQADAVTQTTDTGIRRVSQPSRWSTPNAQRRNY